MLRVTSPILALVLASVLSGCAGSSVEGDDVEASSQDVRVARPSVDAVLVTDGGIACRVSASHGPRARAILDFAASDARAAAASGEILSEPFARDALASSAKDAAALETCERGFESWALDSLARGERAPYDVAALTIPHLAELKLLLTGGGIAAGLMGDHVGAACMSAIGAGLDYGERRGWVRCRP